MYPDLFWPLADVKGAFKKRYGDTWYQFGKNGGFCRQYGGQRAKTDATFRRAGAYDLLDAKLPRVAKLSKQLINYANRYKYVETLPDKSVDPRHGYPILCSRLENGHVSPTVPLAYHVSGTAMWATRKAMPRCHSYLKELTQQDPRGYHLVLQVHDELVFDFPFSVGKANLGKVLDVKRLMEKSGEDIGIPLKVSVTYHPNNWGEGG